MAELPIIKPDSDATAGNEKRGRRIFVHSLRVALFVAVLLLIRFAQQQSEFVETNLDTSESALSIVNSAMPEPVTILPLSGNVVGNPLSSNAGETIGFVLQTSPAGDNIVGYSGPTNCLITLDMDNRIYSVSILSSGDTIEHVDAVRHNAAFFQSFRGLGFESTDQWSQIDAVSGATLTSYSIIASVANRIGEADGKEIDLAPLKFEAKPKLESVASLFPTATKIETTDRKGIWNVFDNAGSKIGSVLTTSPVADHLSGYQGPTATIAGFGVDEKCVGLVVDQTYENEPYASYLNDDAPFLKHYRGLTLEELSAMDPATKGIEGVSGATMTSMCVADGLPIAATAAIKATPTSNRQPQNRQPFARSRLSYWADFLTIGLTLLGIAFSFTKLSRWRWFRIAFQIAVIVFLGFVNGHMLSQALVVGWSTHAIPWSVAPGLVFLSLAALAVPIFSKHQPYCHHVCPFGAMQQLGRNRLKWKVRIAKPIDRLLSAVPFALLILVVIVATSGLALNLASIEPFDGFSFRVAGWATISILIFGMLFSLVSPMAYCRFGCPTGALLNFLRFRADSDRLGFRDLAAATLVSVGIFLNFS